MKKFFWCSCELPLSKVGCEENFYSCNKWCSYQMLTDSCSNKKHQKTNACATTHKIKNCKYVDNQLSACSAQHRENFFFVKQSQKKHTTLATQMSSNPFDKVIKELSVDGTTYKYFSLADLNDDRIST